MSDSTKVVTFRPFTGNEQKTLLIAKESGNTGDIIRALISVLSACAPDTDVKSLPLFDLELLFLAVRAKSVGNIINVRLKDRDDGKHYDATIDLDNIVITTGNKVSDVVDLSEGVKVKLRFPTALAMSKMSGEADEWDMMAASIAAIIAGDDVTAADDVPPDELKTWLKGIPLSALAGLREFFESRPKMTIAAKYKNAAGEAKQIEMSGIGDFFE